MHAMSCPCSRDCTTSAQLHHHPAIHHPHRRCGARSKHGWTSSNASFSGRSATIQQQQHLHATEYARDGLQHSCQSVSRPIELPQGVSQHQLPKHVALIMDGNSRWAAARGLPSFVGHERGVSALRSAVMAAWQWRIQALTVYAFSVENWQRDTAEVTFLMDLFQSALQQQLPELQQHGVKLSFMGQSHRLPPSLQQQIAACEAATADNDQLLLNVAVSYSAQQDMLEAVQQLAQQVKQGQLEPQQITSSLLSQQLASSQVTSSVGPPDLLIRTSGEQRLSNFMLWECAYTELCFVDVMWPDFDKQHFERAIQQYAQRQRRFGRRS